MTAAAQREPGSTESAPKKAPKTKPRARPDNTGEKQVRSDIATRFQPGQSGNPAGRPKGARNVISQRFLEDMLTVWNEPNERGNKTGIDAIREIAKTRPGQFVAAVGNLVPREFSLDDETQEGFMGIWQALAKASASKDD